MASSPLREKSLLSLEESIHHAQAELLIAISVISQEPTVLQTTATLHLHQEAAADLHQLEEDLSVEVETLPLLRRQEPQVLTELQVRVQRRHAVMIAKRLVDHVKMRSPCADPSPSTATILIEGIHAYSTLISATW